MMDGELQELLIASFRWRGDSTDPDLRADPTGWWRNAAILQELGSALSDLQSRSTVDVVVAPQSRGLLVGALVANALGAGLVEARKDPSPAADSDAWVTCTITPDYKDRQFQLGLRRDLLQSGDHVLFVDDWIATGSQARGCFQLVNECGATWIGSSVIVDGLENAADRRLLNVRSLLHVRSLGGR